MCDVNLEPQAENDNYASQLHQLIDSVIERTETEKNRSLSDWKRLNSDNTSHLTGFSFVLRHYNLTVISTSPACLSVWRQCLETTAEVHLGIEPLPMKTLSMSVTVMIPSLDIGRDLIEFIAPLIHRTHFEEVENDTSILQPERMSEAETTKQLNQLIDKSTKHIASEAKHLINVCKLFKIDKNFDLDVDDFIVTDVEGKLMLRVVTSAAGCAAIWKACIKETINSLKISANSIKIFEEATLLEVTMKKEDFGRVLDLLKPLATRMIAGNVGFSNMQHENMSACVDFLMSSPENAHNLSLTPADNQNFKQLINIVERMGPTRVTYSRRGIANETEKFLFPLANIVDEICILEEETNLESMPMMAIKEILRRKCKILEKEGLWMSLLSLEGAEELVKFFHTLKKQIFLKMPTLGEAFNVQIGEYSVICHLGQEITISHLKMAK